MTKHFHKAIGLIIFATLLLSACATPTPVTIVQTAIPQTPIVQTQVVTQIVAGTPVVQQIVVTTTPIPAKKAKLTVWQFGPEGAKRSDDGVTWANWWKRKIEEFNRQSPNVEIDWALKGQESGGTTLFIDSAVAAGTPPDIYLDVVFRQGKFAAQGLFEPMDSVFTQWDALDPALVQTVTGRDGKRWGIPLWVPAPTSLAINKTLAEAAGAADLLPKEPDRDWTTDEYKAFCKKVTQAPQRYCTMFFAKTPSFDPTLNAYAGGFGANLYTKGDYCKTTINSPEGVKWMDWMNSLITDKLVVPGPAGLTDDDLDAAWSNQQIAMAGGGLYYVNLSKRLVADGKVPKLDVYLVNYPHEPGRPTAPLGQQAGWVATVFQQKDPDKKAAAIQFMQYITGESFQYEFANGYTWVAPFKDLAKDWAGADPDKQWLIGQTQKNGLYDMGFSITNFNEVRLKWAETRQAIWSGDKAPKDALDVYVADANALLCK